MMGFIYQILLTFNSTSWLLVIYVIQKGWALPGCNRIETAIFCLLLPLVLTLMSLVIARFLGNDNLGDCKNCDLADAQFLPVYLGYFFVALSIPDKITLIFVYAIVFLFTYLSQAIYFNPLLLLFGYHFYHVTTLYGTKIFVIAQGTVIRKIDEIDFSNLKRINDTTFLKMKGEKR